MVKPAKLRQSIIVNVSNLLTLGVILTPLLALLLGSIQTERSLLGSVEDLVPKEITLSNYLILLGLAEGEQTISGAGEFPRAFFNSAAVGITTTVITIALASLTAYSVARLRWRGSRAYVYLILLTRMMPEIALIIPLFLTLRRLGLLNSYLGLVVTEIGFYLPFATWILMGYLAALPWELEDAARIDGCSRLGAFVRIILPLSAPGMAACAVIIFLLSWHMLVVPLIISSGPDVATLPVLLSSFVTDMNLRYTQMNAAAVMALAPTVILVLLLQKYVVAGLTAGALKG